jgi:hypothetical protein
MMGSPPHVALRGEAAGSLTSGHRMLSTPTKRFIWSKPARYVEFTFFRALIVARRRPKERVIKQRAVVDARWKPADWTPWLWMK